MKLAAVLSRLSETRHLWTNLVAAIALMLLLGAIAPSFATGDPLFAPAVAYEVGGEPVSLAIGDFNRDGFPDLAVVHWAGGVSVLLGNGDGTFGPQTHYATDNPLSNVRSVAVGDLNRDGKLDLITASARDNVVSVLLGNGDGTFAPRITTDLGWGRVEPLAPLIRSLAFGDLNADGKLDMVFADGSYSHSVLLGNGDGTFGAPRRYVSDYSASPAIGDFNRDRKPDLAIAGPGVEVRLGNGDGTFGSATLFGPYEDTHSVAIGDMNGDGDPDLVAVTVRFNDPSWVSVLLGNGDGTFVTNAGYGLEPGSLASVAIGDLNGDGKADVVEAHPSRTNSVGVLLGNGDGTLVPVSYYGAGNFPWSVAIGDFNRDGKPDLAAANYSAGTVSVLLNIGPDPIAVDFNFRPHTVYLNSDRRWVTGTLRVPAPYLASQIDVPSIRLNGVAAVSTKGPHRAEIEHRGDRREMTVKFGWAEVKKTLEPGRRVPVTVNGSLAGQPFAGTDYIRVKGPKKVRLPKFGDLLAAGSTVPVSWDADDDSPVRSVTLLSSLDDGVTWKVEAEGLPSGGSRDCIVPMTGSTHARLGIRVVYDSDDAEESTDSELAVSEAFSIAGSPLAVGGGMAQFALQPTNPMSGPFTVRFSLASSAPATLAAYDVSGRSVFSREVGSSGPGWHTVRLGDLAPGLYLVRLSQSGVSLRSRVMVIR